MVLAGIGVGWLPQTAAAEDIVAGRLSRLEGRSAVIELDVVAVRKKATGTPLLENVWKQVVDMNSQ